MLGAAIAQRTGAAVPDALFWTFAAVSALPVVVILFVICRDWKREDAIIYRLLLSIEELPDHEAAQLIEWWRAHLRDEDRTGLADLSQWPGWERAQMRRERMKAVRG